MVRCKFALLLNIRGLGDQQKTPNRHGETILKTTEEFVEASGEQPD